VTLLVLESASAASPLRGDSGWGAPHSLQPYICLDMPGRLGPGFIVKLLKLFSDPADPTRVES